jgi:AraC-like DNA-binding protein
MNLEYIFYALIPFLTLLQGVLFAILAFLRYRREERYSDKWLALSLIFIALEGVPYMLGWLGIDMLWEKFTYLPWDGFWLASAPTLYLFLKSLTNETWRFNWRKEGWYYLPYFIYFIEHSIVGIWGQFDRPLVMWWWNEFKLPNLFYTILSMAVSIYFFIAAYRLYQGYQKWSLENFSNAEKVDYQWFRNFLVIQFTLFVIGKLNNIYSDYISGLMGHTQYDVMWLGYLTDTILIYYLSISSYLQERVKGINFSAKPFAVDTIFEKEPTESEKMPLIFEEKPVVFEDFELKNDVELEKNAIESPKNAQNTEGGILPNLEVAKLKAGLTEAELAVWKQRVLRYFDQEKPYLNPELSLSDIAEQLKTNTSVLSAVINSGFDKNFNDFVNSYRIEDFKTKINTPQYKHLTLLAVAFDCGFNSKTTFNRAFKKLVGQNPSEFQR